MQRVQYMRKVLEEKYKSLFATYNLDCPVNAQNINFVIKDALREFLKSGKKTAIYCNGGHTKMLMADFMAELRQVNFIIDNYVDLSHSGGFHLIREDEIEKNDIKAVIISSFKFKETIVNSLKKNHPTIQYLDIYDKLAEQDIVLQADYYYHSHPYQHYHMINSIQRRIKEITDKTELELLYMSLITKYIQIKDFRSAGVYAAELYTNTNKLQYAQLLEDINTIYELEKTAAANIDDKNVLAFCLDGLRRKDLTETFMPKISKVLQKEGFILNNAYSFSTSTFESLLPVYSENGNLRTEYYKHNFVMENECRFLREAERQNRKVYFYTDMNHFTMGEKVQYSGTFQTVTEKLWDFIVNAVEEKNGLYYIHVLYESHFTFSNPYTEEELISEGTAMLFDYLPQKGGKLRTNYEQQHWDALRYLDDVISPFLERIKCRMLLYSDHGNIILKENCSLEEVKNTKLNCDEEWVRIPYVIRSPEMGVGKSNQLVSLMSFNDIVIALMKQDTYDVPINRFIKVARSELYNPDFHYLYKLKGEEKRLLAFEAFLFSDGYKLVIYSNGSIELFLIDGDKEVDDEKLMQQYLHEILNYITVCSFDR